MREVLEMAKKIKYILTPREQMQAIVLLLVIFFGALFETMSISILLPFIQALLTPEKVLENSLVRVLLSVFGIDNMGSILLFWGVIIVILFIVKNIYLTLADYFQLKYKCKIFQRLSVKVLKSYMKRPYTFFLDINSADVLRGITGDISGVKAIITNLLTVISSGLTIVLIAVYLVIIDPVIALLLLILGVICFFMISLKTGKKIKKAGILLREMDSNLLKYATQAVNGIKEFSVLQKKDFFADKFGEVVEEKVDAEVTYNFTLKFPARLIEAVCVCVLVIAVCVKVVVQGENVEQFVSNLSMFAVAAFKIFPLISGLSQCMTGFAFYKPALNGVYENIKIGDSIEREGHKEIEIPDFRFTNELKIENIVWKYTSATEETLHNASLSIKKNEAVAIIGASGAGKTTLVDIILGLLPPQQGHVYSDTVDIYLNPKKWAKIIGYVPQMIFMIDDTIKSNVALGIEHESTDDEMVWKALEQAQLKEFVEDLPDGLETRVGDRGIKLSGGQRQRIAIARALYYNPDILILDEATSALDNDTENAVMEAIESMQGHKTLIIVAHRLSTIRNCDRIYEVVDKKVILRDKEEVLSEV